MRESFRRFSMYCMRSWKGAIKIDLHAQTDQLKNAVSPLSVRMAITIVATVPILVVYPFLQKYFVGGMTLGAVKD